MKSFTVWVLRGLGIECDQESLRLFSKILPPENVRNLFLAPLLQTKEWPPEIKDGDLLFFPGGFSFADHFGSGRLLSFELQRSSLLNQALERGFHFFGVCNGFQVLMAAGLFGTGLSLEHNAVGGRPLGFIDRWVHLRAEWKGENFSLRLPVRHGEGRLTAESSFQAKPFLFYDDPQFDNGSLDRIAGLYNEKGRSKIFGMMPHPEIALAPVDDPDLFATDHFVAQRAELADFSKSAAHLLLDKILLPSWKESP